MSKNILNINNSIGGGSKITTLLVPSSSTDNAVVRWDGVSGKSIQNSSITIDDNGDIENINSLNLISSATNPGDDNTLWIRTSDGHVLRGSVDLEEAGSGDVTGAVSSTDNALVRFDTTTGKIIQNGTVTQTDTGTLQNIESLDLTLAVSNPGTSNTIWQSSTNNHIYNGTNDVENIFEYKYCQSQSSEVLESGYTISPDGKYMAIAYNTRNTFTGVVYIYKKEGMQFIEKQELTASNAGSFDYFGKSIKFDYDATRIAIGALGEDTGAGGSGAIYVFVRNGDTWTEEQMIKPITPVANEQGGFSVTMNYAGDIIVGGFPASSTPSRAIVFQRVGSVWSEIQILIGAGLGDGTSTQIGSAVAITYDADRIIVSNPRDDRVSNDQGSVSIWKRDSPTAINWTEEQQLVPSDGSNSDYYGSFSVDITDDGNLLAIHSYFSGNGGPGDGKVYIYKRDGVTWTEKQIIVPPNLAINDFFGANCSFSYDGSILACGLDNNKLYIYSLGGDYKYNLLQEIDGFSSPLTENTKIVCSDGQCVLFGDSSFNVNIYHNVGKTFVSSPSISTQDSIPIFSCTDGKLLQNTEVKIDNENNITTAGSITSTALDLTTAASNPGTANTIWQRTSDGHVLRGAVDLEAGGGSGDVSFSGVSSLNNSVPIYDGTTGKIIKDSETYLIDDIHVASLRLTKGTLPISETGIANVIVGANTGRMLSTGSYNTMFGSNIASVSSSFAPSTGNVLIGSGAGQNAVNRNDYNICIGNSPGINMDTAVYNIFLGSNVAQNATTNQNCIYIAGNGLLGVVENNTIRLGNTHTSCYIAGIQNNDHPNTTTSGLAGIDSNGQLTKGMMGLAELAFANFTTPYFRSTTVIGAFYELEFPATLTTNFSTKFSQPTNGRILYSGVNDMYFHVSYHFSAEVVTANDSLEFALYKNGVLVPNSNARKRFRTGTDWQIMCQNYVVQLTTNDYISIFVANLDSTGGVNFGNINLVSVSS